MSEEGLNRLRQRPAGEKTAGGTYTAKDFQLEVLGQLAELQILSETMEKNWHEEFRGIREQRILKFDSRTLVALGAIALSICGYVIEAARNTAREDSEIDSAKARLTNMEQVGTVNTEGRIRMEEELEALREGQAEIKAMIQARDGPNAKAPPQR